MRDVRNGVYFADEISEIKGGLHTYKNLGSYIKSKTIGLPQRQRYTVKIPARNGLVDLTETLYGADPKYNNRKLQIVLMVPDNNAIWNKVISDISNSLHGYTKYICFDDDPSWAYHGNISIDKLQTSRLRGIITLSVDADPFRKEISNHSGSVTIDGKEYSAWKWDEFSFVDGIIYNTVESVNGTGSMIIYNAERQATVDFKSTGSISLVYGGKTYNLDPDWSTSIKMPGGKNTVTLNGNGVVYSRWRGEKI